MQAIANLRLFVFAVVVGAVLPATLTSYWRNYAPEADHEHQAGGAKHEEAVGHDMGKKNQEGDGGMKMPGSDAMGQKPPGTTDHSDMEAGGAKPPQQMPVDKDSAELQIEASRAQLEASRAQLEAGQMLLEAGGSPAPPPADVKTPRATPTPPAKPPVQEEAQPHQH